MASLHTEVRHLSYTCSTADISTPAVQVYWETAALFRRHSGVGLPGMSVQSEWYNLRQDLIELIAPKQPEAKQKVCQRMQRVYSLFQP